MRRRSSRRSVEVQPCTILMHDCEDLEIRVFGDANVDWCRRSLRGKEIQVVQSLPGYRHATPFLALCRRRPSRVFGFWYIKEAGIHSDFILSSTVEQTLCTTNCERAQQRGQLPGCFSPINVPCRTQPRKERPTARVGLSGVFIPKCTIVSKGSEAL